MKRIIFLIIVLLVISCCVPTQMNNTYATGGQSISADAEDSDDTKQMTEHIYINYARKEKRVKIERYTKVRERIAAYRASEFHVLEFNDTGLLTEVIKRDYSGEGDPAKHR